MGFLREIPLEETSSGVAALRDTFGFVPNLFRAQTLLPRLIEAEAQILSAVIFQQRALSRVRKEWILLTAAAVRQNSYCATLHYEQLRSFGVSEPQIDSFLTDHRCAGLSGSDSALVDLSLRLSRDATQVNSKDIGDLRAVGFGDDAILEALLAIALARMLCTISAGLAPDVDFEPRKLPVPNAVQMRELKPPSGDFQAWRHTAGPYLRSPELSAGSFAPFAFFESRLGVVPNLFRAQTLRPDVIEAEARASDLIVANESVLLQAKKECILLVVAAANLNSYCVAAHCAMLRRLGLPPEESGQIAIDHHHADLTQADKALLDFALKLGLRPAEFQCDDIAHLREHGFNEEQILEAVVTTALGNFLNTLVAGLGVAPDFEPGRVFESKEVRRTAPVATEDLDAGLVARVKQGDVEAFAELIRRHEQRVYRTMMAILRDPEVAQDGVQDAFLKAFKHIQAFQGRSQFATWLMSIARNAAVQLLRDREEAESLDEGSHEDEFRPRHVRAWQDNPEQAYSRSEMRNLVQQELLKLPPKYRVVVMLRDIEQLPMDEVGAILDLSIAAVKTRLFRGRLMLRDSLAPLFAVGGRANT